AGFAHLRKRQYAAAGRVWERAFRARPELAAGGRHRYNAACSAALAGSGRGEDGARLEDAERARWRKQALAWLQADLAAWQKLMEAGGERAGEVVARELRHWQRDADLAGLRDEDALARLPAQEREMCRRLWADVAALLARAEKQ